MDIKPTPEFVLRLLETPEERLPYGLKYKDVLDLVQPPMTRTVAITELKAHINTTTQGENNV